MSRPDGQAPEEAFFKAAISKWSQHRDTLPAPWHAAAIDLDVAFLEARLRFQRIAPDPAPALAARWGVARTTAWRRTRHMLAGDATARNDVQQAATAEPVVEQVLAVECNTDATACNQGATEPATMTPVAMFSAPVEREEEGDKKTKTRAKRAGWSDEQVQQVLSEMHAIALQHNPAARPPNFGTFAPKVRAAAASLRDLAKDSGLTGRELIIAAWSWWWVNPNEKVRETRRGAEGYTTCLRPVNCPVYAEMWLAREAEKYVPTADEALDAVLEVGCSGAEARYPAAARAIRQAFDYEMYGDLARMRAPKDPAKMRAAWVAGYTKHLTPKLSLVAR